MKLLKVTLNFFGLGIIFLLEISSSMMTELMNSEKMKVHFYLYGSFHSVKLLSSTTRPFAGALLTVISLLLVSVHVGLTRVLRGIFDKNLIFR